MKKTMDHVDAIGATGHTAYKNPHTRKLLQNLDNKDYGKIKRGVTKSQLDKNPSPEKKAVEVKQLAPQNEKKGIREIPTYQPPSSAGGGSDWREEFKKGGHSDEELPDTRKLIDKLKVGTAGGERTDMDIEEDALKLNDNSLLGGDQMNDSDVSKLKRQVEEQEQKLAELQAKLNKPPKAVTKKGASLIPGSSQSSGRLP